MARYALFLTLFLFTVLFITLNGIASEGHGQDDQHASETDHHVDGGHGHTADDHHSTALSRNALVIGGIAAVIGAVIALGMGNLFSTPAGIGTAALTAATGGIHMLIGLNGDTLLLLNGLGYFGLLALLFFSFTKQYREWIAGGIILYALITIGGYLIDHTLFADLLGTVTKLIEVGLVLSAAVFIRLLRQLESGEPDAPNPFA